MDEQLVRKWIINIMNLVHRSPESPKKLNGVLTKQMCYECPTSSCLPCLHEFGIVVEIFDIEACVEKSLFI